MAGADFVQESAPERLELKRALLAGRAARRTPDVVDRSSTSGLLPTPAAGGHGAPRAARRRPSVQPGLPAAARRGRAAASDGAGDRASAPPTSTGRSACGRSCCGKEIDGVRRRPAARGAVARGAVARRTTAWRRSRRSTTRSASAPGCGGLHGHVPHVPDRRRRGGMRHFMAQFGPALQWPWTKLMDVPELTDELLDRIVAQSDAQAGGRSIRELERLRDDCLVAVHAGAARRRRAAPARCSPSTSGCCSTARSGGRRRPTGQAAALHEAVVPPEWVDYNGHTNESRYLQVVRRRHRRVPALHRDGRATSTAGDSYFTVETHISYLAQARAGDRLHVDDAGARARREAPARLPLACTGRGDDACSPPAEHMLLHVDAASGRAAPAAPVVARVAELAAAHAGAAAARVCGARGQRARALLAGAACANSRAARGTRPWAPSASAAWRARASPRSA